jgi:tRNA U34 5-methylaminomethyl-2-thiouridine-forming methyltransferase MnmC
MSQPALTWTATGTPVSARFTDPYYADGAGLAEARHVFLGGNDLPARLRDGFRVAELGFGTGLNLLALLAAWDGPGRLHFTSFEAYPLSAEEMERALAPFALPQAAELVAAWGRSAGPLRRFDLAGAEVAVVIGDARATLPAWRGCADAWFLDGFAPARNPELWEPALMAEVARHTTPGGTFATYSAAGAVRRALAAAGFSVERRPGFGAKRHMSAGRLETAR